MSTDKLQLLHITSCADAQMWYSGRVGEFVPLRRRLPEGGWMSSEPGGHSNIVHRLDAEEVVVSVPKSKQGRWPYIWPDRKLVHIVLDVAGRSRAWHAPADLPGNGRLDWPPGTGPDAFKQATAPEPSDDLCIEPAGQSRMASMAEAVANLVVGVLVSMFLMFAVMPLYGFVPSLQENIQITAIFTVASIARSYTLRRFFNLFQTEK